MCPAVIWPLAPSSLSSRDSPAPSPQHPVPPPPAGPAAGMAVLPSAWSTPPADVRAHSRTSFKSWLRHCLLSEALTSICLSPTGGLLFPWLVLFFSVILIIISLPCSGLIFLRIVLWLLNVSWVHHAKVVTVGTEKSSSVLGQGAQRGLPRTGHTVAEQLRASERSHRGRLSGPDHSLTPWARGPASCVGGAFLTWAVSAPAALFPPALTLDPLVGKGGQLPRQWASRGSSGPLQVRTPAGRGASAGDGVMESEAGTQWGLGRG